jgi:ferredoxin
MLLGMTLQDIEARVTLQGGRFPRAGASRRIPCVDVCVSFQPGGRSVVVAAGSTLLEAARRAGLPLARACGGDALCGRCGVTLLSDESSLSAEEPRETSSKRRNRIAAQQRLACCAAVLRDLEVTTGYW